MYISDPMEGFVIIIRFLEKSLLAISQGLSSYVLSAPSFG